MMRAMTTIDAATVQQILDAPQAPGISGVKAKAKALEDATGLKFTDYAQYGCYPGKCTCPSRFSLCRAWERFTVACREAAAIPAPAPTPILNRHGVDVRGKVYSSKSAAMFDLYASPDLD